MSALEQAEAELRIAATAFESHLGVLIVDPNGIILRANRAFTELTGYAAAEVIGQSLLILESGAGAEKWFERMWQALVASGSWQEEIWSMRKEGGVFASWVTINAVRDDGGHVTHYVATLTDITQLKTAEAKVTQLAFYDPMTDLPNRRLLNDRLQTAILSAQRNGSHGALLFIDIDNFKTLNDTQGHGVGDMLLREIACLLTAKIRDSDTAARFGGDEFVVILNNLGADPDSAAAHAESLARTILAALGEPLKLRNLMYRSSASIGITLFSKRDVSADELLKQCDMAMYEAKAAGRSTLRFFDAAMQAAVTRHAELVEGLRAGLDKDEFVLLYQPQVDHAGRIFAAEVLLRWNRPGDGLVSPGSFISVAEDSRLIHQLGTWVLESTCRQLAAWAAEPTLAGITLAVNVSANQFARADFVDQLTAILSRTGANPQRLKLEITESLLFADVDSAIGKMNALKKLGIGFSLDDFGTGYSSLSYLQRLPLDQLKIDQSFVAKLLTDRQSLVIAQMIISLGQSLGLSVIAEGIEEEAQREMLASMGCHTYQGYLFGRPMQLDELSALIVQQRREYA